MYKGFITAAITVAGLILAAPSVAQDSNSSSSAAGDSTADHSKFELLQQDFSSGPAVTAACLSCHTEADDQVMQSIHYTWDFAHPTTGQSLGKRRVINSFCGSVVGNEPRCTSCHVGYGWDDMTEPPPQESTAVDCLVCHDTSGQYTKLAAGTGAVALDPLPPRAMSMTGAPAWPVDLQEAAQSVGRPSRETCGACHFYSGGGDNVKHGDLSSALYDPPPEVDVHMSREGANFVCADCHVSSAHNWPGSRYAVTASDPEGLGRPGERRDVATCQSCHGTEPHEALSVIGTKLNDHGDTLACQTCHIPEFAKGGIATKTLWDWSTAGQLNDEGKPIVTSGHTQSDGKHLHTYHTMKGTFEWAENVRPIYEWFDGQVEYANIERTIDPSGIVEVNTIKGDPEDGVSRIWPFKRMDGRQAYDSELNRLVYTHVFGPGSDTAFWGNFEWDRAIAAGMAAAGADYSGSHGFVDTYMYWPVTHMVSPAAEALTCDACHAADGRLADLEGIAMPGTDAFGPTGRIGLALVLAAFAAVSGHALLRVLTRSKETPNG